MHINNNKHGNIIMRTNIANIVYHKILKIFSIYFYMRDNISTLDFYLE